MHLEIDVTRGSILQVRSSSGLTRTLQYGVTIHPTERIVVLFHLELLMMEAFYEELTAIFQFSRIARDREEEELSGTLRGPLESVDAAYCDGNQLKLLEIPFSICN